MTQPPPPPPGPPSAEPPASSGTDTQPTEHRFSCEQCGADYRYDPQNGTLTCDHCGHQETIRSGPWRGGSLRELDFETALSSGLAGADMEETRVLRCPNCAAQVELDPKDHAGECPFCATPMVTDTGTHRHIKPKGVLPFAFDERSAHKAMSDWLGQLWFAPNGLQQYARKGRRMDGIYVPYWTFDAETRSQYRGQRGTVYYVTETVMVDGKRQSRQVPKVRWRPVTGRVQRFFDDVLVLASKSLPKKNTDALEPWDLSALEPYQPQYLAGFRAEAYAVELADGYSEANARMRRVIERDVRFDIGGDRQRIEHIDSNFSDITFKHVLLPVWLAAYKYRGKTYRFVVNGQSGRVQGERPYSAWKIASAVILALILGGAVAYFGSR
ncbi:primosomal protein N' (replication factor Y) - superfamily II helicase [Phaeobacter inhibens]|uniref:TFIIB-type zinc finger domain-containing protein n=1 Tax=Phaeobacter inhibens TaxID=221822 RepID=UPI000971BCD4|nr:TFIIB-type zinc finger domain-containing protein [Phaeobacter inhibens]APX15235.1 primosomal protein N' (replication factor Y) - superfamily II helicase [Phaeobacter inhibens]